MAIKYVKYQNQNESSPAYGKTFLRAVQDETIDLAGLADHMAEHDTVFSKGIIIGVLTDMARCIRELVLNSKAVKIDDLCILRLGFSCNGADSPEKATVKNITGLNINSMGTGRMAVKTLINQVQFKELKKYNGLENESDTEENPGGGSGGSGNQQENTQQPTLFTLTWKHDGTVQHTEQLAEGATITEPNAPSGYHWKDVPATMPGHALEILTEEDSNEPPVLS